MESGSSEYSFIPEIEELNKPKLGQHFTSLEHAQNFYHDYAKAAGFSVRIECSKKRKGENEVCWRQLVCNKEGHTTLKGEKRNRGTMRVGCKARINLKKEMESSNWTISTFVEEHNHELTSPSKKHLLPSNRGVSSAKRNLASQFAEANIPTCTQLAIMSIQAGGVENLGFVERDLRNVERDVREECKGVDADTLFQYFSTEKDKDPSFFFEYEKDEDNRMTKCFWADSTSKNAYSYFGDVVVFDTTYCTNRYDLVFAPLFGLNHHGQTIFFGCGLINGEKTEHFEWLFDQWLKAMDAPPPRMIITDQDLAMTNVISSLLDGSYHRYCIWHIMMKFPEKLGRIKSPIFFPKFKACVYGSETVEEFLSSWNSIMDEGCFWGDSWLEGLFEMRQKWVPAYSRDIFSAGMLSSQRAESGHSFLKKYVFRENSLVDFVVRFNRALHQQRHHELECDHIDINETPRISGVMPVEKQMGGIYTKSAFLIFQNELNKSFSYIVKEIVEIGGSDESTYTVEHMEGGGARVRVVGFNVVRGLATCSCPFFDTEGIPCRHILAYLRLKQELYLPEVYILPRWIKSIKLGRRLWKPFGYLGRDERKKRRHAELLNEFLEVVYDGSFSDETAATFKDGMRDLKKRINEVIRSSPVSQPQPIERVSPIINDPLPVKRKGWRGRLKSRRELVATPSNRRACGICGVEGHNSRRCPEKQQDDRNEGEEDNFEDNADQQPDIEDQQEGEPLTPVQDFRDLYSLYQ